MKKAKLFFYILKLFLLFSLLTILTQVGGLLYLLYQPFSRGIKKKVRQPVKSFFIRAAFFSGILVLFSLLIVPMLARPFGRVPLPLFSQQDRPLKPANLLTVFANRHYVEPELKEAIIQVSSSFAKKEPGTTILYLDANFPFFNGFPLIPHLSHDDGEKLDIGFVYKNKRTGDRLKRSPTLFGYGLTENPSQGEFNQPAACEKKGYWQYSLLTMITLPKPNVAFDASANKRLLQLLAADSRIGKIFIEPHLKNRLELSHLGKIRYHGCHAVRHDDHIHIQQ